MALTRKLPKLKNVVEVICPPSVLCLDCAYWHEDTGCEHGRKQESTAMAIFGYCGLKKTKEEQHEHEIQKMNRFLAHGEY